MLTFVVILAANAYDPRNPLTNFPVEIRDFLKTGMLVTYSINFVLALRAYFIAKSKSLPGKFWFVKVLLLGGIPFNELTEAKDQSALKSK